MRQLVGIILTPPERTECVPTASPEVIALPGPPGKKGEPGSPGSPGQPGRAAFTSSTTAFKMPAPGQVAAVGVLTTAPFIVGQAVYLQGAGYFEVLQIPSDSGLVLKNVGGTVNVPTGALVAAGGRVTAGGIAGPDIPAGTLKRRAVVGCVRPYGTDGGAMMFQITNSGTPPQNMAAGRVEDLQVIEDPDGIASIANAGSVPSIIRLPLGLWKVRARVPSYGCKRFAVELWLVRWQNGFSYNALARPIPGTQLGQGSGYSLLSTSAGHAVAEAIVPITDPGQGVYCNYIVQDWKYSYAVARRDKAKGVAASMKDEAELELPELFAVFEIIEL